MGPEPQKLVPNDTDLSNTSSRDLDTIDTEDTVSDSVKNAHEDKKSTPLTN